MATSSAVNGKPKQAVVCVFCASCAGNSPAHLESARILAHSFHASNISLVYGAGTHGMMGELARSLVSLSGPQSVHGVIPRALIRHKPTSETAPKQVDMSSDSRSSKGAERDMSTAELKNINSGDKDSLSQESEYGLTTVVPDMHTRKRMMAQMVMEGGEGSGFVALAGGYGTIEEVMEMVTWNQLGIHRMPIVLVNIDGYWDGLLQWVRKAVNEGYVREGNATIVREVKSSEKVLDALREYTVSEERCQLDWSQG